MTVYPYVRRMLRTYPQWHFKVPRVQVTRPLEKIGSDYGGYFLDVSSIPSDPIIYSVGVGEDISFDLCLVRRYGFSVHAFDPTPRVRAWLESQNLPINFLFQPIGIADFDGQATFYLPPRSDFISHSLIHDKQYSEESVQVPVERLSTVMRRLGHNRLDVLKMDIEGAEYAVLANSIDEDLDIRQIVVEFHHRLSSVGTNKTRQILDALHSKGMRICHICDRAEVMTLIKEKG